MIGQKFILLDEVDSTNNYAATLISEGKLAHGTVILAGKQTAGRGQRGNSWSSVAANQLACSFFVETAFLSGEHYLNLNLIVSLAVRKVIQAHISVPAKIKWPNDVLVADKKMAGILIEAQWREGQMNGAVIGVGINLKTEPGLPSGCAMEEYAASVPEPFTLASELAVLLENGFRRLKQQDWEGIRADYHAHLWKMNEPLTVEVTGEGLLQGAVKGIDEEGNLLFETAGDMRTFGVREVKFNY